MATPYAQRDADLRQPAASHDVVALVARVLLAAIFVLSGFGKIGNFAGTTAYIASSELPFPQLGALVAIVVELGGGLLLVFGWKARTTALILAIFSVAAGLFFHAYWADADPAARMGDFINFWKNISIAGGFLMLFAFGPGRYSLDRG